MERLLPSHRPARLRVAGAFAALCCVAVAALQLSAPSRTVALASGGAGTKKWVPSLGFYVDEGKASGSSATRLQLRSPTNARTYRTSTSGLSAALDSALEERGTPREEALRLHAWLAHLTSKRAKRFMKAFKQEARHTGSEATEEYLASMLRRDKKRHHMLSQARQLAYKYKGHEQWSKTPNFNAKGYWPLVGDPGDTKMLKLGVRPLAFDKTWVKSPNFNVKGYWPLDANTKKMEGQNVAVNSWPIGDEHPMPEQAHSDNVMSLNYWSNFLDSGSTGQGRGLKDAGISHKWWDTHNLKRIGFV